MKNRNIVEYVIYPRLFHSLAILYKGTYCVSFKLYHVSANKTITYAYPFIINHPEKSQCQDPLHEEASLHVQSNFSFETERFSIVYEEDAKKLKTQCVFRLEYPQSKVYSTYLSIKLLKKLKKEKKGESNLCTRAIAENKYQVNDTQIVKLKEFEHLNQHQRLFFHCSEFFSCIDFYICRFKEGSKPFRGKSQLSDLFAGYDLSKCDNPIMILKQKKEKNEVRQEKIDLKQEINDLHNASKLSNLQLQNMIEEYCYWFKQINSVRKAILLELNQQTRRLAPLKLQDLSYLNRDRFLQEPELHKMYGTEKQEQLLVRILEEKQLLRYNIRALRQYYCMLLFYQSGKQFNESIGKSLESDEKIRQEKFVKFKPTLNDFIGEKLRDRASVDFADEVLFSPEKIERIPLLLVEGYERPDMDTLPHRATLTIFVHGYQGNSFDFQKAKNYLKKYNKSTSILIVESITGQMDRSIQELGKKVAQEVIRFRDNSITKYECINFVGFSLGGLIIRACLEELGQMRKKLGIFVSFSSPHLGISESDNSLVKLGVWYLIKVDKVKNLKELNFQSVKLNESILMKLSKCQHISNFSKVILVSSKEDGFVPLYSTFLERTLCQSDILSLCNNLLSRIRRLERVEVLFNTDHASTLDKLTGRRGHIQFLDNHYFLDQFFRLYGPYF